jgi:mannose-6-phosphate isomerase
MCKLYPLKFKEVYKNYIWGGKGLEEYNKRPPDNFAAESWEIASHKDGMSVVANGALHGKSLKELTRQFGTRLLGTNTPPGDFPLLVKFINANKKLSVQVHPDDGYAMANEGERGKNEAWIVLSAKQGAELILGLRDGVTKEDFMRAVKKNETESCLNKLKVKSGDVINIPSGLIHAIGKGIILAEIQQNSNTTYRIYDYNRTDSEGNTRPLHIKKAYDVIDFEGSHINTASKGLEISINDECLRKIFVANKYFCIETYKLNGTLKQQTDGSTFLIYIFTEGEGAINYGGENIHIKKGDTYLIPACLGEFNIEGKTEFIKSYVPDIKRDVVDQLLNEGYTIEPIKQNISGIDDTI